VTPAFSTEAQPIAASSANPNAGSGIAGATVGVPTTPGTDHAIANGKTPPSVGGGKPTGYSPLVNCGNGCCDYNWTQNTLCQPNTNGATYQWYLPDYGWSYANDSYYKYWGAVCAEVGSSTFTIHSQDGFGGVWVVPQGYYRWESDKPYCSGGGFCSQPWMNSSVNTQAAQATHTYCGGFWQ
jgi:hypothetical protein